MEFFTALAGLKTASELTTRLREALISREVKLDEVVGRIIEVQDMISDGRTALIDAQDQLLKKNAEIQKLTEQVRKLEAAFATEHSFQFRQGVYWKAVEHDEGMTDPEGNEILIVHWDGPFCPTCKDADQKAVRLRKTGPDRADETEYYCDIHLRSYYVDSSSVRRRT
jgi:hypothetical protein